MKVNIKIILLLFFVSARCALVWAQSSENEFGYTKLPDTSTSFASPVKVTKGDFAVTPIGGASYSIPLELPAGIGGMQPQLAIAYNSMGGDGYMGCGFSLSGISVITRGVKDICHDGKASGVTRNADDAFYLDGKRLIRKTTQQDTDSILFYIEHEPFTEVVLYGVSSEKSQNKWHFVVKKQDGLRMEFGEGGQQVYFKSSEVRTKVNSWYITKIEDACGNYIGYEYSCTGLVVKPLFVRYGKNNNVPVSSENYVRFVYESRRDPQTFYIDAIKGSLSDRLVCIEAGTDNVVFRKYNIDYSSFSTAGVEIPYVVSVTEQNGAGEKLQPVRFEWDVLKSAGIEAKHPYVDNDDDEGTVIHKRASYASGDLDGDGLCDIVENAFISRYGFNYNKITVSTARLDNAGDVVFDRTYDVHSTSNMGWIDVYSSPAIVDMDGDGKNELILVERSPNPNIKDVSFVCYNSLGHPQDTIVHHTANDSVLYDFADLNNDGRFEIIAVDKYPDEKYVYGSILGTDAGGNSFDVPLNILVSGTPVSVHAADVNSDGMTDFMLFYDDGYSMYLNDGTWMDSPASLKYPKSKYVSFKAGAIRKAFPGDFNGDGAADFLLSLQDSPEWYILYSRGDAYFMQRRACTLAAYDIGETVVDDFNFNVIVYDMDGDGKSEVFVNKWMPLTTHSYWLKTEGEQLVVFNHTTSSSMLDSDYRYFFIGDFNGDGLYELGNKGYDCYLGQNDTPEDGTPAFNLYFNKNYSPLSMKVTGVSNSLTEQTDIEYSSFVTSDIMPNHNLLDYPIARIIAPLHVVSAVSTDRGAAGIHTVKYRYGDLLLHKQGYGILGFSVADAKKEELNETTLSVKSWDKKRVVPKSLFTRVVRDGKKLSETLIEYGAKHAQTKYLWAPPIKSTEYKINGDTIDTFYDYDSYTGLVAQKLKVFNGHDAEVETNEDFVYKGLRYQPQLSSVMQIYDGQEPFEIKKHVSYNDKGLPETVVENYESSKPITTVYTYDACGNTLTSKTTAEGISAINKQFEYDGTYRFLTKSTEGGFLKYITSYEYDQWGNKVKESDNTRPNAIQTTVYTYDNWNSLTSTVYPTGKKTTVSKGWGPTMSKRYFVLEQGIAMPWTKTYYDCEGREVQVESVSAKDCDIVKKNTYDKAGNVKLAETTVGGNKTSKAYDYDYADRLISEKTSTGKILKYSYSPHTVVCQDGTKRFETKYNGWGDVVSSEGPGGKVDYRYLSCGKPAVISSNGTTVSLEYDEFGNRIKMTDPDAGGMVYDYDALGRVTYERDVLGNVTQYSYSQTGDLYSKKINNSRTVTYSYGMFGNNKGLLNSEKSGKYDIEYTYDEYNRLVKETHNFPNPDFTDDVVYKYEYNAQGLLSAVTYPGSVKVGYVYDCYGNKVSTSVNGVKVSELISTDGYTSTRRLGSSLTMTDSHNLDGLIVSRQMKVNAAEKYRLQYSYDVQTDNLLSRWGNILPKETFAYDAADRLTGVDGAKKSEIKYSGSGNILFKSGMGNYTYSEVQPHAVTGVENTDGLMSDTDLFTDFNEFGKISTINDTDKGIRTEFSYDNDAQRYMSWSFVGLDSLMHIVYLKDCDIVTDYYTQDRPREWFYYIDDNVVLKRDNAGEDQLYYTFTDHLGSVVRMVDASGTEVYAASYDAWGNRTLTKNNIGYIRGYTGHEMLSDYNLINMNGRLYDPLLGRFLSADNFVQEPQNAQNFNRYAYCHNNPLKYIDPDGEFAWFVPFIVGGVVNVAFNFDNINDFGDFACYFGVGAVSAAVGGAVGTSIAASVSIGGAAGGLLVGAGSSAASGAVLGFGNAAIAGGNAQALFYSTIAGAFWGGITGGALGAAVGAYGAWINNQNIWNGEPKTFTPGFGSGSKTEKTTLENIPSDASTESPSGESQKTNKLKPFQNHHFATDKNKTYTPKMKEITDRYDLDLNGSWNKERLPHLGRHPNSYHEWVLEEMRLIDKMPI